MTMRQMRPQICDRLFWEGLTSKEPIHHSFCHDITPNILLLLNCNKRDVCKSCALGIHVYA